MEMGFKKIRFTPAYFPYTEPSLEIHTWHPEKKVWLEFQIQFLLWLGLFSQLAL